MKSKILWPVALILVFALSRLPGAMPQISARLTRSFFASACTSAPAGLAVPLCLMALTDLFLTFVCYHQANYFIARLRPRPGPNYVAYAALIGLDAPWGESVPSSRC